MLRMFLNKANRGHAKHMVLSNKSYSFIFTRKHIFTKNKPMIYKIIFKIIARTIIGIVFTRPFQT